MLVVSSTVSELTSVCLSYPRRVMDCRPSHSAMSARTRESNCCAVWGRRIPGRVKPWHATTFNKLHPHSPPPPLWRVRSQGS